VLCENFASNALVQQHLHALEGIRPQRVAALAAACNTVVTIATSCSIEEDQVSEPILLLANVVRKESGQSYLLEGSHRASSLSKKTAIKLYNCQKSSPVTQEN
jgi:hypothetical protein